jgi:hypothetical protein
VWEIEHASTGVTGPVLWLKAARAAWRVGSTSTLEARALLAEGTLDARDVHSAMISAGIDVALWRGSTLITGFSGITGLSRFDELSCSIGIRLGSGVGVGFVGPASAGASIGAGAGDFVRSWSTKAMGAADTGLPCGSVRTTLKPGNWLSLVVASF